MNKPFFSNFLEEQDIKQVTAGNLQGPLRLVTAKSEDELQYTLKYPSDGDEDESAKL
ncbi:MAG: microviridin/marinostatin family tricyclic proteinase inhibitor [Colwellia sp.]|nr:microviridin/marinostatin family tricyclic proteinase inhibitor [Colwellia sp.]